MALMYRDIELLELMQDFYVLTGIRIALFDANCVELASYPIGEATFCHCMRKIQIFARNAARATKMPLKNAARPIKFIFSSATRD